MSSSRSERAAALAIAGAFALSAAHGAQIDPRVRATSAVADSVDTILVFADQARPALPARADYRAHRRAMVDALRVRADWAQRGMRAWLDAHGIEHRDFWIANLIQARVPAALLPALAARRDIVRVDSNPTILLRQPMAAASAAAATSGITWGVMKIGAPGVWAAGFNGQGVVIGGEDTGYQWDHPALKPHYRGWNGASADHNYNWHDAIHDSIGNPCGNNAHAPCDDDSHGTHTAGTFVGDDGAGNQIGVAPGALWIGCRNMDQGNGTPARYIECMQWMLAPTDLSGHNPNPDLAPDIVSNSWACVYSEGCTIGTEIQGAVNNLVDAGIFYVAAAGNDGYFCGTVGDPPAIYDASFVVGATNGSDVLADFSSRGPASGSALIRPDLSAPGVSVCSSVPTNSYSCNFNGTSMATPHVAGAAALLMSAFPALQGNPLEVAAILRETAVMQGVTDARLQSCGGTPITVWPNYMVGYGRLDVGAAFRYHDRIFADGFDP
jgi:serine protease AprX